MDLAVHHPDVVVVGALLHIDAAQAGHVVVAVEVDAVEHDVMRGDADHVIELGGGDQMGAPITVER